MGLGLATSGYIKKHCWEAITGCVALPLALCVTGCHCTILFHEFDGSDFAFWGNDCHIHTQPQYGCMPCNSDMFVAIKNGVLNPKTVLWANLLYLNNTYVIMRLESPNFINKVRSVQML